MQKHYWRMWHRFHKETCTRRYAHCTALHMRRPVSCSTAAAYLIAFSRCLLTVTASELRTKARLNQHNYDIATLTAATPLQRTNYQQGLYSLLLQWIKRSDSLSKTPVQILQTGPPRRSVKENTEPLKSMVEDQGFRISYWRRQVFETALYTNSYFL
jgi:hypothetical protein